MGHFCPNLVNLACFNISPIMPKFNSQITQLNRGKTYIWCHQPHEIKHNGDGDMVL